MAWEQTLWPLRFVTAKKCSFVRVDKLSGINGEQYVSPSIARIFIQTQYCLLLWENVFWFHDTKAGECICTVIKYCHMWSEKSSVHISMKIRFVYDVRITKVNFILKRNHFLIDCLLALCVFVFLNKWLGLILIDTQVCSKKITLPKQQIVAKLHQLQKLNLMVWISSSFLAEEYLLKPDTWRSPQCHVS